MGSLTHPRGRRGPWDDPTVWLCHRDRAPLHSLKFTMMSQMSLEAVPADTAHQTLGTRGCCPHPAGSCQASRRYPDARIDWLITPENADLVRHHPDLSGTILFPRKAFSHFGRNWSATLGPFRLLSAIRRNRYDLVIDLHGQFRSAVFTLVSGAPVRIGFDRPRGRTEEEGARRPRGPFGQHGWTGSREGSWIAYTHRIPIPTLDVHAVDRYLWLGRCLDSMTAPGFQDPPAAPREAVDRGIAAISRTWWQAPRGVSARDHLGNQALACRRLCTGRAESHRIRP